MRVSQRPRGTRRSVIVLAAAMVFSASFSPAELAAASLSPNDMPGPVSTAEALPSSTVVDAVEGECEWEGLDDRCESWTVAGPPGTQDMVVSPAGERLFTWGSAMAAYDSTSGDKLWEATLAGITSATIHVDGLAVSPDGERIYAVGDDVAADALHSNERDVIVAAYDAASGDMLWHRILGLPAIDENDRYVSREQAGAVAASPDGKRVYITGDTRLYDRIRGEWITNDDVLIAGYEATTGTRQWLTTWGDRYAVNRGAFIVVGPDGRTVYVGGTYAPCSSCTPDFLTLSIRAHQPAAPAEEGGVLWEAYYDGFGGPDVPVSLELAPDGGRVYLTGPSGGVTGRDGDYDWATVAYLAATGAEAWVSRYQGPIDDLPDPINRQFPDGFHRPSQLAVDPIGEKLFVTGTFQAHTLADLSDAVDGLFVALTYEATLAYDAATGEEVWATHLPTLLGEAEPVLGESHASPRTEGTSVDVSPAGRTVYVLGQTTGSLGPSSPDHGQTTVSYDTDTGEQLWIARLPGRVAGARVAVHPGGMSVYALSTNGTISAYEAAS